MTALDLKAIRERAREMASNPRLSELALVDDRAQLLALIDRMTPYVQHTTDCDSFPDVCSFTPGGPCTCGLDELRRELGR